jgi:hypothetical protein
MGIYGMLELENAELFLNSPFEQFIIKRQFITGCARRTIRHWRVSGGSEPRASRLRIIRLALFRLPRFVEFAIM